MLKLPVSLESELEREFEFTRKFYNESALLHNWDEGKIFVAPLPPYRQGSVELYLNKALKCKAEIIVLLLPCDVSTDWFNRFWKISQDSASGVTMRFFDGRIKYEDEKLNYRVSSVLIIIRNSANEHVRTA